jgi:hypothetical protein
MAPLTALSSVARDGGEPNVKAAGDLALAHAGIDSVEQTLTNGNRIGSHGQWHLQSVPFYLNPSLVNKLALMRRAQ